MTLALQQILSGISTGLVYGLLGVALSTVYESTKVLNFSQGALATLSAYGAWELNRHGVNVWLAAVLAIVLSFVMGVLVERALIRPVANAPELTILTVTAAMLLGTTALIGVLWGYNGAGVNSPFGTGTVKVLGAAVTNQQVGTAAVGVAATVLVWLALQRTSVGLKMRATALNRTSAGYLGIDTGRMLGLGWGLACAMGAVAGILTAPVSQLSPDMMSGAILMTFAAFILGGVGSLAGVLLGGVVIGVVTNLGFTYVSFVSGDTADFIPFAVIILVLLIRPRGLFGRLSAGRS